MKSKGYIRELFTQENKGKECNLDKEDYIDWLEEKLTVVQQSLSGSEAKESKPSSCEGCAKYKICNGDLVEADEAGVYVCWESA